MTVRDNFGVKRTFMVVGFKPYAFISKGNEYKLSISRQYISETINEGYIDWWGVPMYTVYFNHPKHVGQQREVVGDKILHQADIHYELACAIKKGLGRYIKIQGDIAHPGLNINQINSMTEKEIQNTKFPNYEKVFLDIEVLSGDDEFPSAREAKYPVVSSVCYHNAETIIFLNGYTAIEKISNKLYNLCGAVQHYSTEEETITAIHKYVSNNDVCISWSNFDKEYLENRSRFLRLNLDWNTIQWFNLQQGVAVAQQFSTTFLSLKLIFDDLFMYKRHAWKFLPEVFQDYFTEEEGKSSDDRGKGMVEVNKESMIYQYLQYRKTLSGGDVKELYNNKKFKELLFYNACDVWDMVMLEKVGTAESFFNMYDGLGLMNMNDIFLHTSKIEPSALRFCMINKVISPNKLYQEGTIEEGAIVHEAKRGKILNNVIVTDFTRFYISIILAKQVSPENNGGNTKKLFTVMPNGENLPEAMFFLPALAHYLINERNKAETEVKKALDEFVKEYWKSQTRSLKDMTSGLWGYVIKNGDIYEKDKKTNKIIYVNNKPKLKPKKEWKKAGRYYAGHVGDEILQESRAKSTELKHYIENNLIDGIQYEVDYGDSDSVFIESVIEQLLKNIRPERIAKQINIFFTDLCKKQGYPYPIQINAEKVYDRLLLVSKKYYYGRIVWEDGKWLDQPKLDIKGMQSKRGDNSQLSKDFQHSVIQNHLEYGEVGITRTILKMNKVIEEGFLSKEANFMESIAIPWKIKKAMIQYDSGKWKYWGESARIWNQYAKLNNLGIDSQIGFGKKVFVLQIKYCGIRGLYLKNKYLVFPQGNLIEWSKIELDYYNLKYKTVTEKLNNILSSIGKDKIEIETISSGKRIQKARF